MLIVSRSVAAVLLAAALALGVQGLFAPRASADGPEFTPICGPFLSPLGGNIQWGPGALQKVQQEFVIESARYVPEEHRYSWVLRTRKAFPGGLADAEAQFAEMKATLLDKRALCAYFYDGEGRKVGEGRIFLVPGERRPDNTFSVFADLTLLNADLVATRAVITLCIPPPSRLEDKKNGKEGDKEGAEKKL